MPNDIFAIAKACTDNEIQSNLTALVTPNADCHTRNHELTCADICEFVLRDCNNETLEGLYVQEFKFFWRQIYSTTFSRKIAKKFSFSYTKKKIAPRGDYVINNGTFSYFNDFHFL